MATHVPAERARWRARKWGRRAAKWLGALAALSVVAVFVLLHNLDRPWVKRRVQAIVAKEIGVAIDYGSVHLALSSGIEVDDLVVASPPEVRGAAPELARVGHLSARWAHGRIERLALTDVAVTIAIDENGRSSLDVLMPGSVPLSHRAQTLLGSLPADTVEAERVAVTLVDTDHGAAVERTTLRGLALELQAEPAPLGGGARLRLGSDSAPLALELERHGKYIGEGTAHAQGHALAVATSSDAAVAIELRDVDQDLVSLPGRTLDVAGRAHFDPPAAQTKVMLDAEAAKSFARGAATIPDEGPVVLHRALGSVDAAGLVHAERADFTFRIVEATLAKTPRVDAGGAIEIDGEVAKLELPSLRVDAGSLDLHVLPDAPTSAAVHGSLALEGVALGTETRATGAEIRVDGRASTSGAVDGRADVRFASLHTPALDARGGHLAFRLEDVYVDLEDALATRGDVAVTGDIASVSAGSSRASTVAVNAHAGLSGHAPYAANAEVTAARLQMFGLDAPARVTLAAKNATVDRARPIASTGTAHVELALGDAKAAIEAAKEVDAVDYELHARAPIEGMAFALESKGRVERISTALPEIRHHTKVDVDRPSFGSVSARSLAVTVDARGTTMHHDAQIDVRARGLSIAGKEAGDDHVTLSANLDRARPALRLIVGADGLTTGNLAVTASFDRARHALAYDVDGNVSNLAPLAPLLADVPGLRHVDPSALEVGVSAKGELLGVVADVEPDGTVRLEPNPSLTAALNGPVDIRVEHFGFGHGDLAIAVPKGTWHADFGIEEGRRTLDARLDIDSAYLVSGAREVDCGHISDRFTATVTGDLENPDVEMSDHASLDAVRQELVPAYPVADVSMDLSAHRDHRGVVRVDALRLASAAGGTKISVSGDLDVSGVERKLALEGEIEQDVARLSGQAGTLGGRGRASARVRVESGDLVVFRTRSDVTLDDVDVRLPRYGVAIESMQGEIPIQMAFRAAGGRLTWVHGRQSSPFALLRFADQHPLLSRTSFLRARSITTPYVSIAPFVGNLQIDRNVVSLAQVEMGVRGGRVTGSCKLDYADEDSTLEVRLQASGLRAANGEQLDAIAAFFVSESDSSVDGRGEILRIGKQQFIELLDFADPAHTNASVNRVRSALAYGYPDRVTLAFKHGFANAHVELGGLAKLFRVGDIRGIPTGPVFERMLRARHRAKGRR